MSSVRAATPAHASRGVHVRTDGATTFSVWAPRAARLDVVCFGDGAPRRVGLARDDAGVFSGTVPGVAAGSDYAFSLDGGPPLPDPRSRWQPHGVNGASRVLNPAAFDAGDGHDGWRGLALADYVIYELHTGTFTTAGTFDGVIEHLDALAHLGVTAIELMPVAAFPGARNWGYDGVALFAPCEVYGGPAGLRRLVHAAHARSIAVVLDVVYNHAGPEGNHLAAFGPYLSARHRSPWGDAFNLDGPECAEVRSFVLDNALCWITDYGVDALRLDAAVMIRDESARHILADLSDAVRERSALLERRIHLIAESDVMDPLLVRSGEAGGHDLHAMWSDDFARGMHVALFDPRHRGAGVTQIVQAIERRSAMCSRDGERNSVPCPDVAADRFVFYVQNHDIVGNRPLGERLASLATFEQCKLAAAALLLAPAVPLLFMGEEYGATTPFRFFTDHEGAALARAVREGRARLYREEGWQGDDYDPQDPATMICSRLDRHACETPAGRSLLALYRDLLALRRAEPALRPGVAAPRAWCGDDGSWLAVELVPESGRPLLALFNFTGNPLDAAMPSEGQGTWRLRFSTRNARYGGPSDTPRITRRRGSGERRVTLLPWSGVLYRLEDR